VEVVAIQDYLISKRMMMATEEESTNDLHRSNVLKYHLTNGLWFCLRPSGTESKAKFYFGVKGASLEENEILLAQLENTVMGLVNHIVYQYN
jgi:phosphoglucomutase